MTANIVQAQWRVFACHLIPGTTHAIILSRAPAAGAVQKASADLVRSWGRLAEKWVLAEQRASEAFFSCSEVKP